MRKIFFFFSQRHETAEKKNLLLFLSTSRNSRKEKSPIHFVCFLFFLDAWIYKSKAWKAGLVSNNQDGCSCYCESCMQSNNVMNILIAKEVHLVSFWEQSYTKSISVVNQRIPSTDLTAFQSVLCVVNDLLLTMMLTYVLITRKDQLIKWVYKFLFGRRSIPDSRDKCHFNLIDQSSSTPRTHHLFSWC